MKERIRNTMFSERFFTGQIESNRNNWVNYSVNQFKMEKNRKVKRTESV
jgi:hypothetical protein